MMDEKFYFEGSFCETYSCIFLDSTSKEEVTIGELNQCEYLDRVIRESLRLFPPAPVVQRKLKNDLELGKSIIVNDRLLETR